MNFAAFGLHGLYMGPIYDNGTSNALGSPLTTELTSLGPIFGIRRQNYQNNALVEKKIFGRKWFTPSPRFRRFQDPVQVLKTSSV